MKTHDTSNDPFISLGRKVDIVVFLLKIGILRNEHEKMFDLQKK